MSTGFDKAKALFSEYRKRYLSASLIVKLDNVDLCGAVEVPPTDPEVTCLTGDGYTAHATCIRRREAHYRRPSQSFDLEGSQEVQNASTGVSTNPWETVPCFDGTTTHLVEGRLVDILPLLSDNSEIGPETQILRFRLSIEKERPIDEFQLFAIISTMAAEFFDDFGAVEGVEALELPFMTMGDVYGVIELLDSQKVECRLYSVHREIAFVTGLKFGSVDSVDFEITEAQRRLIFQILANPEDKVIEEFTILSPALANIEISKMKFGLLSVLTNNPGLRCSFTPTAAHLWSARSALRILECPEEFKEIDLDPFERPPLAFCFPKNDGKLIMKFHHLLIDGKSIGSLISQLSKILLSDKESFWKRSRPGMSYLDFADFEKEHLATSDFAKSMDFWASALDGINECPLLPSMLPVRQDSSKKSILKTFTFSDDLATRLTTFARSNNITLFSAFIAVYRVFVYKLYGFTDFPVIIPVDVRWNSKFNDTVGLFVNLAILRQRLGPCDGFDETCKKMQTALLDVMQHGVVPFNRVISDFRGRTHVGEVTVPNVMLVNDIVAGGGTDSDVNVEIRPAREKSYGQFGQVWYLRQLPNEKLELQIEFRVDEFCGEAMVKQAERFFVTVDVLLDQKKAICDLELLTVNEKAQFVDYRKELTVPPLATTPIDLIHSALQENIEKVVIKSKETALTGRSLIESVKNLALNLKNQLKDSAEGVQVALMIPRSVKLIECVLACWLIDKPPVMLSIDWPSSRIIEAFSVFDNVFLIVENDKAAEAINKDTNSDQKFNVKTVDSLKESVSEASETPSWAELLSLSRPTLTAYLTFTSGSTGVPKAVRSTQIGLVNIWQNYKRLFDFSSDSVVYQVVNPAFDIFFADVISALGNGGVLFLASSRIPSPEELACCTHAYIMPAYLSALDFTKSEVLKALKNLKCLLYGGEVPSPEFIDFVVKNNIRAWQQFGVTEHAIYSNIHAPTAPSDRFVVGRSMDNYHGYIVDVDGRRLPPVNLGITGYFRSAGIGVALGYEKNPDSTVFGVEDYPDESKVDLGWRYFDSGDRMKIIDAQGNCNPWNYKLRFCGRYDGQVKIRGNRIEIAEVEAAFTKMKEVHRCVIVFDDSAKLMAAFVILVKSSGQNQTSESIEDELKTHLPAYMIPSAIYIVDAFPLNSNGKVDKVKLLDEHRNNKFGQHPHPKTLLKHPSSEGLSESFVCDVMAKHLGIPSIQATDDLFRLGADSLKLLLALQEIEQATKIHLDLEEVFTHRTVASLIGQYVDSQGKTNLRKPSFNQQHMYFIRQCQETPDDAYELAFSVSTLASHPNWSLAASYLLTRHAVLRTVISEDNSTEGIVLRLLTPYEALQKVLVPMKEYTPIDILSEPPIKIHVDKSTPKIAIIRFNHIAVDGTSLQILLCDLARFLANPNAVAPLPDETYFDFAESQQSMDFTGSLAFFKSILQSVVNFSSPVDHPRAECTSFAARHVTRQLMVPNLDAILDRYTLTGTQLTLAAYGKHVFSHFESILTADNFPIGVPFANRQPANVGTVGYFVNSHAVLLPRPGGKGTSSDAEYFTAIRDRLLAVTKHSGVPLDLVVTRLKPKRAINKSAIYQRMVIFQDLRHPPVIPGITVTPLPAKTAKFEQTWRVKRLTDDGCLEIDVEYVDQLFDLSTVEGEVDNFILALQNLTEGVPGVPEGEDTPNQGSEPKKTFRTHWAKVLTLNHRQIKDETNFFEAGGHSLAALRLCSLIKDSLHISCPVKLLFEHQTFEGFTRAVCAANGLPPPTSIGTAFATTIHAPSPLQKPLLSLLHTSTSPTLQDAYVSRFLVTLPLDSPMQPIVVQEAFNQVIRYQPALRTTFRVIDFPESSTKKKPEFECHTLSSNKVAFTLSTSMEELASVNPFTEKYPLKATIDYATNTLHVAISHVVCDGQSMNVLAQQLAIAFSGVAGGSAVVESPVVEFPTKLIETACQEFAERFENRTKFLKKSSEEFWREQLAIPCSVFEVDYNASNFTDYSADCFVSTFSNVGKHLMSAMSFHSTGQMSILIQSLAHRLRERLRNFDSCMRIGFVRDMRDNEDLYSTVGFFVNTLVVSVAPKDTIRDVGDKLDSIYEHSAISIDDLAALDPSGNQLFEVMLVIDNAPSTGTYQNLAVAHPQPKTTKFDLTIFIQQKGDDVALRVEWRKALWSRESIEGLMTTWMSDLIPVRIPIDPKPLVTVPFDTRDISILIIEACERYPNNTALRSPSRALTYGELKIKLLQIAVAIDAQAFQLTGRSIRSDDVVAVVMENSIDQWLICLGCIIAGVAYLPISAKTPQSRIQTILSNFSLPLMVVTSSQLPNQLTVCPEEILSNTMIPYSKWPNFRARADPHSLAYIIFTSGTTGQPKGVCIARLGLPNMIDDARRQFGITEDSVIYQFTNFCFDNSVLEVFAALGNGASCFVPEGEIFTPDGFVAQIEDYGITHAMLFPGLVNTFSQDELVAMKKLKCWICGAEKLPPALFSRVMALGLPIVQNCGPTETTAYCLVKGLKPTDDPQNLGRPIQNARVSVRRPDLTKVAPNSKGELYIATVGLFRGYVNRPWSEQPFVTFADDPGAIYYPSGDICQLLPNGEVKFIGRKDSQIKIRGFRVELEEIERAITDVRGVNSSKVFYDEENQEITAFVASEEKLTGKSISEDLKSRLPHYMIPRNFVVLKKLPLTGNNKVDMDELKKQIAKPPIFLKMPPKRSTINSPRQLVEGLWREVLNIPATTKLEQNDNFFYYGGHSLTAQKFISELRERHNLVLKLQDFYQDSTIGGIVEAVCRGLTHKDPFTDPETPSALPTEIPLSFQQEQMLFVDELSAPELCNLAFINEYKLELDVDRLTTAYRLLINHHEILRTMFYENQYTAEVFQKIITPEKSEELFQILEERCENDDGASKIVKAFHLEKFNLFKSLPIRAKLIRLPDRLVTVTVIHHVASDASTTNLLARELASLYDNPQTTLETPKQSYAHFSVFQKSTETIENLKSKVEAYLTWMDEKIVPKPVLSQLSTDFKISTSCKRWKWTYPGQSIKTSLAVALASTIRQAYFSLMPEGHTEAVLLGILSANRELGLEDVAGNFLTTMLVPLLTDQLPAIELQDIFARVTELSDVPYAVLAKILKVQRGKEWTKPQLLLNCRYNLENDDAEFSIPENIPPSDCLFTDVIDPVVACPIEVDLDQMTNSSLQFTLRISNSVNVLDADKFASALENGLESTFGTPKNVDILEAIRQAAATVLGIAVADVDCRKSFIELGGDSILLLRLRRLLARKINQEAIDMALLMSAPSLDHMAAVIHAGKTGPEVITFYEDLLGPATGKTVVFTYPLVGGCISYTSLISQLRSKDLVSKGIIRVLGLKPPGRDDIPETVEALAQFHARQLIFGFRLENTNEVTLIGASFGGALAFAIAQELSPRPVKVISIDGTLKTTENDLPASKEAHRTQIAKAMSAMGVFPGKQDIDAASDLAWDLLGMAVGYEAPIAASHVQNVALLATADSADKLQAIWKAKCQKQGQFTYWYIEGNHETMLGVPFVDNVANIVFELF